jgi:hypothetical protein
MYFGILNGLFLLRVMARTDRAHVLYWLILLGLFLFSAFRFRVGCDWSGYYYNYLGSAYLDYADAFSFREPLWWLIQVAFHRAGLSYPWVNVLTSAIFFAGIHALARRQPDRLGFLVLLFPILIINMPMSGIRQGAAIGLLCLSMLALIDQRPLRFVAWILLASTIHASAMAFLLLTPLATGKYTRARIALTSVLAGPGLLLMSQSDEVQLAVARYVDTDIEAFGAIFRVGILTLSGFYFLVMLRGAWTRQFPRDLGLASIGSWMMTVLILILPFSSVIADRFGYYLIPIQAMIFARIPYLRLGPSRKLQAALPYLGLLVVFAYWSINSYNFQKCYVPYQTWLFGYPEGTTLLPFE